MRLDHLEDGVYAQVLMRMNRVASVRRIAHQKIRVDATAAIQLGEIEVDGFVPGDVRADGSRAGSAGISQCHGSSCSHQGSAELRIHRQPQGRLTTTIGC